MYALAMAAAALGAGFYRYWHVPAPDAGCDATDTRRADRSMVGPVALGVLATGCCLAGRAGAAVLLHQRVTAPHGALPLAAQALVGVGVLAAGVALLWWLLSAPVRVRVARGLHDGTVVRLPDDPPAGREALHAAATQLGRVLLDGDQPAPEAGRAVVALTAASDVLVHGAGEPADEQHVRRRCEATAHRLGRADRRGTAAA